MRIAAFIGAIGLVIGITVWAFLPTSPADEQDQAALPPSAEQGDVLFSRYCTSCHVIAAGDGTVLAGSAAKAGPNLYHVIGRPAGQINGFPYSTALIDAGEIHNLVWSVDSVAAYIQDPTGYLRAATSDDRARGKMSFRLRTGTATTDAHSIALYLATFSDS